MKLLKMRGKKKKIWPKMEGKKIVAIDLWQWNYRNERKKKIVAIDLWQCCCRNGREKNCGN